MKQLLCRSVHQQHQQRLRCISIARVYREMLVGCWYVDLLSCKTLPPPGETQRSEMDFGFRSDRVRVRGHITVSYQRRFDNTTCLKTSER